MVNTARLQEWGPIPGPPFFISILSEWHTNTSEGKDPKVPPSGIPPTAEVCLLPEEGGRPTLGGAAKDPLPSA